MRIGRFQVSGTCWLRKDPVRRGKASTDSPSKCAMKCVERVDVELVGLRGDSWILRLHLQCLSSKTANYPLLIRSISTNDFYRHIQGTRWCGVKRCPNEVRYIKQRYHGFTYRNDYLILNDTVGWHEYDKNYPSQWRILETGKEYYFYFVIYNTNSVGGGKIGYIVDSQGSITDFPSDNVVFNGVTAQDLANFDWVPPVFEYLQGLDDFRKSKVDQPEIVDINAPTEQEGRPKSNLIDGNTNEIYVSRWNPATDASPYPQQYTLDFMTDVVFDYVKLSSCANMDRDVLTENLTVQCGDKILYLGEYNSTDSNSGIFHFYDNTMCKELKLSFSDNSINWSDQGSGICLKEIEVSTYFSASKVVPVTSSIFSFNSDWKDVEFGAYYNGVGKYASSGSSVEFRLNSAYVASVWINGVKVGSFSPNILDSIQYTKQYKAPLFVLRHLNYTSTYTVKVQVESGELGLSGVILMDVEENDDQESGSGLSGGAIAGITIAVLLVVAGIAVGGVFLGLYLKHRNAPDMDLQV